MASYQRCDRCGKSTEGNTWVKIAQVLISLPDDYHHADDVGPIRKDFCSSCRDELKKWLNTTLPREEAVHAKV